MRRGHCIWRIGVSVGQGHAEAHLAGRCGHRIEVKSAFTDPSAPTGERGKHHIEIEPAGSEFRDAILHVHGEHAARGDRRTLRAEGQHQPNNCRLRARSRCGRRGSSVSLGSSSRARRWPDHAEQRGSSTRPAQMYSHPGKFLMRPPPTAQQGSLTAGQNLAGSTPEWAIERGPGVQVSYPPMSVLTVSGLSKTYATGFHALKNVDLRNPARRDLRAARSEWRRQDHAHQHHLRHRHGLHRHGAWPTATTSCATSAPPAPGSAWCRRNSPPTCSRRCGTR